jgi:hypothetical protein
MSTQYFILLQYHSTCFGCPIQPSSGVQETVFTATGIGHTVKYKVSSRKEIHCKKIVACSYYCKLSSEDSLQLLLQTTIFLECISFLLETLYFTV